jgi:hypothetical protein
VLVGSLGRLLQLVLRENGLSAPYVGFGTENTGIYYETTDCTGQGYVSVTNLDVNYIHPVETDTVVRDSARFFVADAIMPAPVLALARLLPGNVCSPEHGGAGQLLDFGEFWLATEVVMPFPVPIERPLQLVPTP